MKTCPSLTSSHACPVPQGDTTQSLVLPHLAGPSVLGGMLTGVEWDYLGGSSISHILLPWEAPRGWTLKWILRSPIGSPLTPPKVFILSCQSGGWPGVTRTPGSTFHSQE